jgi:glycerol-3-phosphate acyltransferase PlsY
VSDLTLNGISESLKNLDSLSEAALGFPNPATAQRCTRNHGFTALFSTLGHFAPLFFAAFGGKIQATRRAGGC